MAGEIKPEFGGLPYNPEPAIDPTHTTRIDFLSCGQRYCLVLAIPLYIWHKLTRADWDQVEQWVRDRAESVRISQAMRGNLTRWTEVLEDFARKCVYNQFSKAQVAAGNGDWAAPEGWS